MPNTTSSAVRAELARRGLSQAKLGEALGIGQTQVNQRLTGHVEWRLSEIRTVAAFLDVPVSLLIGDADSPAESQAS